MTWTGKGKSKIQRVNVRSYCKHGIHIIDERLHPNDVIAKRDSSGKWICGDCQEEEIKNMIKASKKRRGIQ
jgi:superfamily II helicase